MASVNLVVKQTLDITCMRNDTYKLIMDWTDADSNPIDVSLYTFKAQVRLTSTASGALLTFDDTDFDKNALSTTGKLIMTKSSADMDVKGGTYVYDLQATTIATGDVATWLGGLFIIAEDVTT